MRNPLPTLMENKPFIEQSQLGWVAEAITAGASIFNSISANKAQKDAAEAADRQAMAAQVQAQLALQAQRESDAAKAASTDKLIKVATIGGVIIVSALIIFNLATSGPKTPPETALQGTDEQGNAPSTTSHKKRSGRRKTQRKKENNGNG